MNPSKKYVMIDVNGELRMIDARLVRFARPLIGPALAVAEIPWVERLLVVMEDAYFSLSRKFQAAIAVRPRSWREVQKSALKFLGLFRGKPFEKPALFGLIIACVFSAELTAMAVHRYLQIPDYPEAILEERVEKTGLDRALAMEVDALYNESIGHEQLNGKLVPPLPAFVETESCFAAKPCNLLRVRWPAVKLPVTASVRRAVVAGSVRMPVDERAFHPLDKESILRAERDRLRPVLAMVTAASPKQKSPDVNDSVSKAVNSPERARPAAAPVYMPHDGRLSALFESGGKGVYAIGYDPKGGTSYGKYQFSSRKGALDMFLRFLDKRAPKWAQRLRNAGKANTGYSGGPVARQWKLIAAENSKRFEYLQDLFVHDIYYLPAVREVMNRTGVDLSRKHGALREVLWSTAVQHGPSGGADIFVRATRKVGQTEGKKFNKALVEEIFRERELTVRRMPSAVKPGVKRRLKQEKSMALTLLAKPEPAYEVYKNL